MANSEVPITPGVGAMIATDLVGSIQYQTVKLDLGPAGVSQPAVRGLNGGLSVEIPSTAVVNVQAASPLPVVASAPLSVTAASPLGVAAAANAPVAVRLSDGTNPIATLPVSGTVLANQGAAAANAGAWPIKVSDGTNSAGLSDVGGAKALKVDVVQAVGAGAQADRTTFTEGTTLLDVIGGIYDDGAVTTPSVGQAAAARITQQRAQHVNLRNNAGTEIGTSGAPVRVDPTGVTAQPVTGTVVATLDVATNAGKTAKTANLNTGGGTDTVTIFGIALPGNSGAVAGGSAANPVRTDPTGTTPQPVSGTVTTNQGATPWVSNLTQVAGHAVVEAANGIPRVGLTDAAGAAFSAGNPVPTQNVPSGATGQTPWKTGVAISAGQTAIALHTPAGGKTVYVEGFIVSVTTTGGVTIFDGTDAAANRLFYGRVGNSSDGAADFGQQVVVTPARPIPLSAANNVLRYTTVSAVGFITAWGYEA